MPRNKEHYASHGRREMGGRKHDTRYEMPTTKYEQRAMNDKRVLNMKFQTPKFYSGLALVLLVGLGVPLLGSVFSALVIPDWRWPTSAFMRPWRGGVHSLPSARRGFISNYEPLEKVNPITCGWHVPLSAWACWMVSMPLYLQGKFLSGSTVLRR